MNEKKNTHDNTDQMYFAILKSNAGFAEPHRWIAYARRHDFKKVSSLPVKCCPDCKSSHFNIIGSYIYYSTLINMRLCLDCQLCYSDKIISEDIVNKHFEHGYKDEEYFVKQRKSIFDQIANTLSFTRKDRIIDIGGGKGHLLYKIIIKKDINIEQVILNDLSKVSCQYAKKKYGFSFFCGRITDIGRFRENSFTKILLIDVIYYESNVNQMWRVIDKVLDNTNGELCLRIPNKFLLTKINLVIKKLRSKSLNGIFIMEFFNPEHVTILTPKYLLKKFISLGFTDISLAPSNLLHKEPKWKVFYIAYYYLALLLYSISGKKIVITPSIVVKACRCR